MMDDRENDEALFDAVVSGDERQEESADASPEAPQTAKARDEKGRFAPGDGGEKPEVVEERPGFVPSSRHREEADARRAAESRLAQAEAQNRLLTELVQRNQPAPKKEEPADPLDSLLNDPAAYFGKQLEPIRAETAQVREFYSRRDALKEHGKEKVDEAYGALDAAIRSGAMDGETVRGELRKSMDPFGDIMTWHGRNSIMTEIGSDPAAYRERIRAELLAESQASQTEGARPSGNVVKIPASLNRATSAASTAPGDAQAMSDRDLFNKVTARR